MEENVRGERSCRAVRPSVVVDLREAATAPAGRPSGGQELRLRYARARRPGLPATGRPACLPAHLPARSPISISRE